MRGQIGKFSRNSNANLEKVSSLSSDAQSTITKDVCNNYASF